MTEYTIDAAGKTLGRVASEAAKALMGKMSADYTPNKRSEVKVVINNVSKLSVRDRKRIKKTYLTYSGYPGGLKRESFQSLSARRGSAEPLKRAVLRMLPRNTFRTARIKNLTINA
ncbi:MAG: 50S ribosomal protein L13 [Candidatus Kaiserbacteria bacterium]|nr:MAG: 50S ribosomal protein L13 [Candidatus Kaiserbacteria bacterium]